MMKAIEFEPVLLLFLYIQLFGFSENGAWMSWNGSFYVYRLQSASVFL